MTVRSPLRATRHTAYRIDGTNSIPISQQDLAVLTHTLTPQTTATACHSSLYYVKPDTTYNRSYVMKMYRHPTQHYTDSLHLDAALQNSRAITFVRPIVMSHSPPTRGHTTHVPSTK